MGKGWRTDSKKTLASILVLKVRPLTLSRIANLSGKSECAARGFSPIINPRSAKVTRRDIHFFLQPYGDRLEWFMPPDKDTIFGGHATLLPKYTRTKTRIAPN